ncbi:XAP5-domain-containing protein [Colletotrichum sublineola]|nr:XAP5-domain-containing protein [Colletotrichum sublineola]
MSDQTNSRFTPSNKTVTERISDSTVGLVALSDFRKRRAEVLDQQDREREAALSGASTPDRSGSVTSDPTSDSASGANKPKKKKKKISASKLSFGDDEEQEGDPAPSGKGKKAEGSDGDKAEKKNKIVANSSVAFVPKVMSKAALRREAAEREALRREFLAIQEAVMATEIAIPFVFYDGSNIPGGTVRVKKGDYIWVFLDKSRKVGAELGVGEKANARREWARVGVDDLMLVRGSIIIPHHYEFYYFIINKNLGPGGQQLFNYSAEAPPLKDGTGPEEAPAAPNGGLTTAAALKAAAAKALPDINTLEGATDDPTFTKVVDRRWYERNKHIYPASMWQKFDPEKDYNAEVRKDAGGNTFFFSR